MHCTRVCTGLNPNRSLCIWRFSRCVPEVLAQGRGVVGQQRVDQTKELHDSLILPQVLVALQQEHELVAVATCRRSPTCNAEDNHMDGRDFMHQWLQVLQLQQVETFYKPPTETSDGL